VDEGLSYPLLQQLMAQHPNKRLVVTGFISRNQAGETVLLGRNGSDYSATQIGALAGASRSLSGATSPGCTARIRAR
jgi:aspartokinase/homoserine dehydrogenase 2